MPEPDPLASIAELRGRPGPGPSDLVALLPLAREVADRLTDDALAQARAEGASISCRAGCAACCRQLVVISVVEAVGLADTVGRLPPGRQAAVRARFAAATRALETAGLLDPAEPRGARRLRAPSGTDSEDMLPRLAREVFALGIPCPFLENESCSIYAERPGICREYHVSSPAERCGRLFDDGPAVERISPAVRTGPALMRAGHAVAGMLPGQIPLLLALEWADAAEGAARAPRDPGTVREAFFAALDRAAGATARPPEGAGARVTATVTLAMLQHRVELTVTVPAGAASPRRLLPVARAVTEAATALASEAAVAQGRAVSCRAGCGACCRYLVPLAPPEARELADLVSALPPPRQMEIRRRFLDALARLDAAGLLEPLRAASGGRERWTRDPEYLRLALPCPFLEEESCSIHPDRPLICREYLVTSPAERCATPETAAIERIALPIQEPLRAFARAAAGLSPDDPLPWVPLVLALEWAASNPEPAPTRTGPELLQRVLAELAGTPGDVT